ncbi:MAG: LysR family transcriptional regulator [Burkholderiales bacterium]|nr:LysR family transcriptional regulator [Rhodocyclaceae bacterium]MCA3023405.1 LysR family transcriptional regulator [Rhodocyclaceae bacterium]MCA3043958.1 LysR family transcriptional regulator [Rhodocyclaceae bacterium]MCA3051425.1 LysR family transcriptional regulator [Rhodocyclaceae bacterium]MCA3056998.1 LysR family transcriptional regulator [Rhodocyclaceae bacterium]
MRTIDLKRLNFHHLHYFWVVAKDGNLTRAAGQLHISQSALSSQIRRLEDQLGHALFDREGRALRLTEVGHVVLGYAEGIFNLGRELISSVSGGEGQASQQLRIGAVATLSRNFLENFLRPAFDDTQLLLALESASLEELLERMRVHKLDLILSNRPVVPDMQHSWRCKRIARQPVCLVGPPMKRNRKFRFPDDLPTVKLLLPGRSSDIRTQFELLCEDLSITARPYAEVDDMAMLRLLARDSGGVALVPEVVVQDELKSGVLQKYCELPKVVENFYSITTERQFQPSALKRLLAG